MGAELTVCIPTLSVWKCGKEDTVYDKRNGKRASSFCKVTKKGAFPNENAR